MEVGGPFVLSERALADGRHVLVVEGELDLASAPVLRSACESGLDEGTSLLLIDLTAVRYIDSTGLSALVAVHRRAERRRAAVALIVSPDIRGKLELAGLDRIMSLVTSEDLVASSGRPPTTSVQDDAVGRPTVQ